MEVKQDLQERTTRWRQIESLCGFSVSTNPGIAYLETLLRNGSHSSRYVVFNPCKECWKVCCRSHDTLISMHVIPQFCQSARHGTTSMDEDVDETGSLVSSCAGTIQCLWMQGQLTSVALSFLLPFLRALNVEFFLKWVPTADTRIPLLFYALSYFSLLSIISISLSLWLPGKHILLLSDQSSFVPTVTGNRWGNVLFVHLLFASCVAGCANAALKQLVSTSTLVFLTSAAGPPVASAASLLPYTDGRNNVQLNTSNRASHQPYLKKYPFVKRDSSVSLESASALINSYGSVQSPTRGRFFSFLFCCVLFYYFCFCF